MYKASQYLVDILVENGFRNKSHQYVHDHGKKFKFQQPYNSGGYKRVYGFGQGKRKLEFYFNYINMAVRDGGSYITEEYLEIDECKLRSIIAYFKCSYARQKTIRRVMANRIELAGGIMKEQREMGWIDPPFDEAFEKLYNEVIISENKSDPRKWIEEYLSATGQTEQDLYGGGFCYGLSFIVNELVPMALKQKKKIVWHNEPGALDGTYYTLANL